MQVPAGARLECDFGVTDAIGSAIIWLLLTIVTLGLAAFVAPYYIASSIVNKTRLVDQDGHRLARLEVSFTLAEIVGHAVIWLLLAIVTLGQAMFVYYYMVLRKVLNRTELLDAAARPGRTQPPATAAPAAVPDRSGAVRR